MEKLSWTLLAILLCSNVCAAYKILVVFPFPGKSHSILGYGIVKHLLNAGHEVTYVTPVLEKNTNPKLHQIDVSKNYEKIPDLNIMDTKNIQDPRFLMMVMRSMQQFTLENANVQKFLGDPTQTFDAVIAEWLFNDIGAGYAAAFDAPLIWSSSVEPHWMIMRLVDEALSPAYSADPASSHAPPFTFKQRAEELWVQIKMMYHFYMYVNDAERNIYDRYIAPFIMQKGRQPPSFDELKFNASLILGNSHVALGQATRLPQSYKPIAGYHIDDEVKPLPEDLQKIMDSAKDGVIYFSMGSNVRSKDLPEELKKSLLKMFSGLKQIVLWKFEESFSELPSNVRILKWAPQQSILSHPNCVLFITHGGLLSTTETVHFGVPIIGIPLFGDQFLNVDRSVKKGFAKRVDLSDTMADDLKVAIGEIVNDPKYNERVRELSLIYHDRPVSPGAELVHWVEHVVKTRGAPHLRSPGLHVPWYQKMYLDLAAVIAILVIGITIALRFIFSVIFSTKKLHGKTKVN